MSLKWARLVRTVRAKFGWFVTVVASVKWLADWWGRGKVITEWADRLPHWLQFLNEPWVIPVTIALGLGLVAWAVWDPKGSISFDTRWLPSKYQRKIEVPHVYIVGGAVILVVIVVGYLSHKYTASRVIIAPSEQHQTSDTLSVTGVPPQQKKGSTIRPRGRAQAVRRTEGQKPPDSAPISIAPYYGNLKSRAINLGQRIVSFAQERRNRWNNEISSEAYAKLSNSERYDRYSEWLRSNEVLFRGDYFDEVNALHDELAEVHLHDPELDRILSDDKEEMMLPKRMPMDIDTMENVGERLIDLAKRIPG